MVKGHYCHAIVSIKRCKQRLIEAGEGAGVIDALFHASCQVLSKIYPEINKLVLRKYQVRTADNVSGSDQQVYVAIEFSNGLSWVNIGASTDLIDASWQAIYNGINYFLFKNSL